MHDDELLDLVNDKDEVIGTLRRSEYDRLVSEKLGYIRAVEMFITNDEGELWIPQRTAHKRIAPNSLDYSMGGHVSSGEDYITAALREIKEELNLDLSTSDLKFIKKFSPTEIPYFRVLYIYHSNVAPRFNPDDFVTAHWLSPWEILEKIRNGTSAKLSLQETVEELIKTQG